MLAIVVLVAMGGKTLLLALGHAPRPFNWLVPAGALAAALISLRAAYNPADPAARVNVSRNAAYACAAAFALVAVLAPAPWAFGTCIAATEVAIVFDLVSTAARGRTVKGN